MFLFLIFINTGLFPKKIQKRSYTRKRRSLLQSERKPWMCVSCTHPLGPTCFDLSELFVLKFLKKLILKLWSLCSQSIVEKFLLDLTSKEKMKLVTLYLPCWLKNKSKILFITLSGNGSNKRYFKKTVLLTRINISLI